jgi:uncharacterized membrane protein (Fun14 family)
VNVLLQKVTGVLSTLVVDGPWRSKSVLAALAAVLAGVGIWFHGLSSNPPAGETGNAVTNASVTTPAGTAIAPTGSQRDWSKPYPFYVPIGASYVAGFCIGWFFRKLIRVILIVTALVITFLALGKFAGCNVAPAQQRFKQTGEWAQHETASAEDYLMKLLPSAGAGGAGAFLGFRRRSRMRQEPQGQQK